MAEKIALPLVWVQLHWETVAFLGVAETVIDDGQGALPVFEKVFCGKIVFECVGELHEVSPLK